jgi:hypothetical protein
VKLENSEKSIWDLKTRRIFGKLPAARPPFVMAVEYRFDDLKRKFGTVVISALVAIGCVFVCIVVVTVECRLVMAIGVGLL